MNRRYLTAVTPLPDYILQVDFVSGSRLLLDMKPYLDKIRFRPLADARVWNSAVTNGIFVRFGDVELSHDEILSMAEQELSLIHILEQRYTFAERYAALLQYHDASWINIWCATSAYYHALRGERCV